MSTDFSQLLQHMIAAAPDAEQIPASKAMDMGDPRHVIAVAVKQMRLGAKADLAYYAMLPIANTLNSALVHAHALSLAAEMYDTDRTGLDLIGYHTRVLQRFFDKPQDVDARAMAASENWPAWVAKVHASTRRRLLKYGLTSASDAIAQQDALLGIEDQILNPPVRGPKRKGVFDNQRLDGEGFGSRRADSWAHS